MLNIELLLDLQIEMEMDLYQKKNFKKLLLVIFLKNHKNLIGIQIGSIYSLEKKDKVIYHI